VAPDELARIGIIVDSIWHAEHTILSRYAKITCGLGAAVRLHP
jgi:hypothetical protein